MDKFCASELTDPSCLHQERRTATSIYSYIEEQKHTPTDTSCDVHSQYCIFHSDDRLTY